MDAKIEAAVQEELEILGIGVVLSDERIAHVQAAAIKIKNRLQEMAAQGKYSSEVLSQIIREDNMGISGQDIHFWITLERYFYMSYQALLAARVDQEFLARAQVVILKAWEEISRKVGEVAEEVEVNMAAAA